MARAYPMFRLAARCFAIAGFARAGLGLIFDLNLPAVAVRATGIKNLSMPARMISAPIPTKGRETDMRMEILKLTRGAAAIAATIVALAACTSNPVADEKIAVAKASVQRAEVSGAPEYAPVELATARDELARAQQKNADRDLQPATMLAEKANIDAQLAE